MAQAEKTITRPIMASVIFDLAFSVPALSPPEVIHSRPPQKRYTREAMAARIIIIPRMLVTSWPISVYLNGLPPTTSVYSAFSILYGLEALLPVSSIFCIRLLIGFML